MSMVKLFSIIITGIIVSCYFFPFEFVFLPGVNTKMALAGLGLLVLGVQLAMKQEPIIRKDLMVLSFIAAIVSLIGMVSVTYNNTNDYTYVTYIVSMWVWLSGAYVAVSCIRFIHGYVSVKLVCDYLIGICVAQCLLAILIDFYTPFKILVDSTIIGFDFVNIETMHKSGRLYGIGASLDVAGSRFSAVLMMIAYWAHKYKKGGSQIIYILSFLIISIVGNMIGRTTTVGLLLAFSYWIYASDIHRIQWRTESLFFWKTFTFVSLAIIPLIVLLYQSVPEMYNNIRFAFEGFFSLAENGKWEVHSNNILMNMFIFPESIKTWIIGDGYFDNPYMLDLNYIGPKYAGFYMQTDVGYLRFIFYFGLLGLFSFCSFFISVGICLMRKFKSHRLLFMMFLSVNFLVWFKVSTDIFLVFAPFLCIDEYAHSRKENI